MRSAASESIVIPLPERGSSTTTRAHHIEADLRVPEGSTGLIVFAHGSGSSRFSQRNQAVAEFLEANGFGTLLLDLLTRDEEAVDVHTSEFRFDIARLARRVVLATDWTRNRRDLSPLPIALFGASTGAAAALIAAAERPNRVRAVVSRGGRPDLADRWLPKVVAPTLLLVGGRDEPVIEMNREAMRQIRATVELRIVAGATHLFEEAGALEQVMQLAAAWFRRHLNDTSSRDDFKKGAQ
jgi:pimeloyl-ACP methyl ester carboxylesterase